MSGFTAFLRKELTEIRRTWRLWVIPGMLVFFGLTSPIIAALTPALVQSMSASQPGVVIRLPPPTALDASVQFLKNLNQFVLLAIVIAGAGVISGERAAGTAILVLTKPLSRAAFVVAKILSQLLLLVVSTALGTAACLAMTAVVFDGSGATRLLAVVALWLVYATVMVVVMTFFSASFASRGAAAGAGLAFYFIALLLSGWGPTAQYTFAGLWPAMRDTLMGNAETPYWPLISATAFILAGSLGAIEVFRRKEL